MNHPDDDRLLKSVLQLLDAHEESQLQEHLAQCNDCRTRFEKIRHQTEIIGSIEPETDIPVYPLPRARRVTFVTLMKVAALLLIGFMAGYATSNSTCPEYVNVVPQQLKVTSPPRSVRQYTSCESVDMAVNLDWPKVRIDSDSFYN